MEVVATIVGKLWDCSFDATRRQFRYLCGYKDSVERLRIKAENLEHTRERVQGKIDEATAKGEIILSDVTNWIERVDGIAKEAEHFREDEDKANKRCLKGLCINPWSCYCFGKEAERKIEAISNLQLEGAGFESVSRQAPPPRNILIPSSALSILPSSALSINFQSRELITRQIMEMLKDENVSIIGICGMGGVGKTTLANEISKQAIEKKLFDFVVMVAVSQTQNYVNIQRVIAKRLGFNFPDDDESARAHFLCEGIMKKKLKLEGEQEREARILIVLDDVWEGIELGRVGIPFASKGCKIVLTSRIEDVCGEMNAKTFKVGTLPKEESWRLFRDVAGGMVDNPDINPIAREVADECCGLPLALVTVAAALKTRDDKYVWIDAKHQLKKSDPTNIRGMDRKVFASLKLSYDFLENKEQQSVFLLCCLFPEDFDIPIELLMKYGMGLRFFQGVDTVDEARCRTYALVRILIASFLLIPGYKNQHVKMHDIVRDFAIKLSKEEHMFMVKAGIQLPNWPSADTFENFTGISLMYNDIREVPDHGLEYPKLQALLLQENSSLVVSNNFFKGMRDLKVLDMSRIHILQLPQSLVLLANLTTLHLDGCKFGDKADISLIGRLTNLEILSLNGTDIAEIPGNFGQLVKLKMFYLKGCLKNILIPQAVISCLKKLEDLHVSTTFGLVTELQILSRKTILRVVTEDATLAGSLIPAILSIRMPFLNSTSFDIEIGCQRVMLRKQSPPWSRIVYLAGINYHQELDWAYSLTKITDALQLRQIVGLRNILPDLGNHGFNDLKFLQLVECLSVVHVFDFASLVIAKEETKFLLSLNHLKLRDLSNMMRIWNGDAKLISLCNLKRVSVSGCSKLRQVFPPALLRSLVSLEHMEIDYCDSLEEIFGKEEDHQEKEIVSLKIDHTATSPRLGNLVFIKISGCNKLKSLFTPSIAKGLVQLRTLKVVHCSKLEEIISDEKAETEGSTERIMFPGLYEIDLSGLDSLTCFCARRFTIEFPALKLLDIQKCPKMETFGRGDRNVRIWNGDAELISHCNLKHVSVLLCFNLRQVFPPALLQSLVSLEHMEIDDCDRLEEIFGKEEEEEDHQENEIISLKIDHTAASPCLGNLVSLETSGCPKLENLFTSSIAKGLVQLRTLKVVRCSKLEEIISDEKAETGGSTDRITFPSLHQIDLRGLDSLTCFCARRCTIEFPALELLDIECCPKMETFGRGDQAVTPKLVNMIHLDGEKRWMDNLNITVQQFFMEKQSICNAASTRTREKKLLRWSKTILLNNRSGEKGLGYATT